MRLRGFVVRRESSVKWSYLDRIHSEEVRRISTLEHHPDRDEPRFSRLSFTCRRVRKRMRRNVRRRADHRARGRRNRTVVGGTDAGVSRRAVRRLHGVVHCRRRAHYHGSAVVAARRSRRTIVDSEYVGGSHFLDANIPLVCRHSLEVWVLQRLRKRNPLAWLVLQHPLDQVEQLSVLRFIRLHIPLNIQPCLLRLESVYPFPAV